MNALPGSASREADTYIGGWKTVLSNSILSLQCRSVRSDRTKNCAQISYGQAVCAMNFFQNFQQWRGKENLKHEIALWECCLSLLWCSFNCCKKWIKMIPSTASFCNSAWNTAVHSVSTCKELKRKCSPPVPSAFKVHYLRRSSSSWQTDHRVHRESIDPAILPYKNLRVMSTKKAHWPQNCQEL